MRRVLGLAILKLILAVAFVVMLAHASYWLCFIVLATIIVLTYVTKVRSLPNEASFVAVADSTMDVAVLFLCIAGFGYSQMVSWWIVAPLLLLPYAISYMGLRIGIATHKVRAPQLTHLQESVVASILLASTAALALWPRGVVVIAQRSVSTWLMLMLLIFFVYHAMRYVRLAYVSAHKATAK